jgi:hypothetical protein
MFDPDRIDTPGLAADYRAAKRDMVRYLRERYVPPGLPKRLLQVYRDTAQHLHLCLILPIDAIVQGESLPVRGRLLLPSICPYTQEEMYARERLPRPIVSDALQALPHEQRSAVLTTLIGRWWYECEYGEVSGEWTELHDSLLEIRMLTQAWYERCLGDDEGRR